VDGVHTRVVAVGGAEQLAGAFFLVVVEDVFDGEDGHRLVALVDQGHFIAHRQGGDHLAVALAHRREAQRHRPHHAIGQPATAQHRQVVGLVHEALVGREHAGGDHLDGDHRLQVDADRRQCA